MIIAKNWVALGVCTAGLMGSSLVWSAGSCLIGSKMKERVSSATIEEADQRFSVLRPCQGQVKQGDLEIIYSVGDGVTQRSRVSSSTSIQQQLQAIEKRPLVDIWPSRSILATAVAFAQGKRASTAGLSGFDGADGTLPVQGDVVAIAGLKLHLKLHGLNPNQPIRFSQAGWSMDVTPSQGIVEFPVGQMVPGSLRLAQGSRSAALTVVSPNEITDVLKAAQELVAQGGSPGEISMRRAVLYQENDLRVNAISEMMSTQGE